MQVCFPSQQPALPLKGKKVVIDPGHGGKDPGAIGAKGQTEAAAVLAMSQEISKLLTEQGAEVRLTRNADVQVGPPNCDKPTELQSRIDIGNNWPADLFVSVHCNANASPNPNGTETYHMRGDTGASKSAATFVQKSMIEEVGLKDRGVKEAAFYVLKHAKIPSILVETAFISNAAEEALIADPAWQKKMAGAIAHGVEDYLVAPPPAVVQEPLLPELVGLA